jgi:SpoVK/Ycf46/Vps4 family AAA+-type ATPase
VEGLKFTNRVIDCWSQSVELRLEDFEAAQKDFTPIGLKEVKLEKSDVRWEDVGGGSRGSYYFRISIYNRVLVFKV